MQDINALFLVPGNANKHTSIPADILGSTQAAEQTKTELGWGVVDLV